MFRGGGVLGGVLGGLAGYVVESVVGGMGVEMI